MSMHFSAPYATLDLAIVSYGCTHPSPSTSLDELNWLMMKATYQDDEELIKDSNICLLTYELEAMTAGLKVLAAGLRDVYQSDFEEPYFSLKAYKSGGEGYYFEVSFTLPNVMSGIDQAELEGQWSDAQLSELVQVLEGYCKKFPQRNNA